MTDSQPIPAAQYLRMSTEHQQYSLENQSTAIQKYAEIARFRGCPDIFRCSEERRRSEAQKRDFANYWRMSSRGTAGYQAILVYDVSRWGRFQDTDESAHYEFLCKSAGVPVHYCAETFANDGTLPSLIMKALKRTMAGEYSRELGVKVFAGQKRLTFLDSNKADRPGYGLRRMLVSASGCSQAGFSFGRAKEHRD